MRAAVHEHECRALIDDFPVATETTPQKPPGAARWTASSSFRAMSSCASATIVAMSAAYMIDSLPTLRS